MKLYNDTTDAVKQYFLAIGSSTEVDEMLSFCSEWSLSIEVQYDEKDILTRVCFPFPPKVSLCLI